MLKTRISWWSLFVYKTNKKTNIRGFFEII